VPNYRSLGPELNAVLDDHASRNAEIVLLQVGTPEPRRLLDSPAHGNLLGSWSNTSASEAI
jgi:hypothetical protein